MKRLGSLCLVLLALSGCIPTVPLNDRAMVRAVAVDLLEDGRYQVTLQVNEAADGGSQAGSPEQTALSETGWDLTGLLTQASVSRGKQMFLGSARLILLGERLAQEDVLPALRFFNATQQVAPTISVAVVEGEAGALIRAGEQAGQFSADGVLDVLQKACKAGYAPESRMLDFFSMEQSQGGTPQLVVLRLERHGPDQDTAGGELAAVAPQQEGEGPETARTSDKLRVVGTALFSRGRMAARLDPAQSRGLQWLHMDGRMEATPLAVELPGGGLAASKTYLERVKVKADVSDGVPVFSIQVQARSAVLELPEHLGRDWQAQVAALQGQLVEAEIRDALKATAGQGWDPCGFYQLVRQSDPAYYRAHREDWGECLQGARFSVEATCQVSHTGGAAQREY